MATQPRTLQSFLHAILAAEFKVTHTTMDAFPYVGEEKATLSIDGLEDSGFEMERPYILDFFGETFRLYNRDFPKSGGTSQITHPTLLDTPVFEAALKSFKLRIEKLLDRLNSSELKTVGLPISHPRFQIEKMIAELDVKPSKDFKPQYAKLEKTSLTQEQEEILLAFFETGPICSFMRDENGIIDIDFNSYAFNETLPSKDLMWALTLYLNDRCIAENITAENGEEIDVRCHIPSRESSQAYSVIRIDHKNSSLEHQLIIEEGIKKILTAAGAYTRDYTPGPVYRAAEPERT